MSTKLNLLQGYFSGKEGISIGPVCDYSSDIILDNEFACDSQS